MRVTIAMVAKEAGVSRGTVDRVINNRGNVKPEVEKHIREIIEKLGYKPNRIASALSYNKNPKKIVIIARDIGECNNELIFKGIENGTKTVSDNGIDVDVWTYNDSDIKTCLLLLDRALSEGYDAVAVNVMDDPEIAQEINKVVDNGIPVVTYNSDITGSKRCCFIGQDLYKSGRVAGGLVGRLMNPERRVLIFSSDPKLYVSKERTRGFVDNLKQYGISTDSIYSFRSMNRYDVTYSQLEREYEKDLRIGAIYMANDSNVACGDFIASHYFDEKPIVVCHDLNRNTIKYLKNRCIDYVIEQNFEEQSYNAIIILNDILRYGEMPTEAHIISDLSIKDIECL
jgi:LacI family transcriptional regulator